MTRELDSVVCMDALEYLKSLADSSIDMILTSPPYDNLRTYNGYTWDFEGIARDSYRVLKTGGVLVWVVGDSVVDGSETLTSFEHALFFKNTVGFRVHDTMIWQKDGSPFPESNRYWQEFEYMFVLSKGTPKTTNLLTQPTVWKNKSHKSDTTRRADGALVEKKYAVGTSARTMPNVWDIKSGYMKTTKDEFAFQHPAMFPEKLAERHILTWTNAGDIVLDYFMGSGTTAKMARANGRRYLGCDISQEYVDLARKRLALPYTVPMFDTKGETS